MASILRQIVAGPRARHPDTDLDLSYITDNIIATSGPSQTYPQRAYRNPLDHLVSFLDAQHGENWAIWEFRAEGTGYPDDAVYGRVRHYPFPDHHPPPFRLVPMVMASMRNWLHGGELHHEPAPQEGESAPRSAEETTDKDKKKSKRVVVVHCKAGKGRSGTLSCSYLISEEGWKAEDALVRFTQRRMRPQFGAGVSIPSQLRWITYVDRWTRGGKKYIDRPIEILEVHVWGLRNGVKVDVEAFEDEGKKMKTFHTFTREERLVVEGDAPDGKLSDMVWELAGYPNNGKEKAPPQAELSEATNDENSGEPKEGLLRRKPAQLIKMASSSSARKLGKLKTMASAEPSGASPDTSDEEAPPEAEPGGMAVILKPKEPIRIPNSDVSISVERRNRTHKSMGVTMVTAVGHVWFNAFFEGKGPEQDNHPSNNGVFSIDWDAMDGIKGTSRKGTRALDRLAVVWRVADETGGGEEVEEPAEGKPVPQTTAADWKGASAEETTMEKNLGLRTQSPASADVSQGSSVKSIDAAMASSKPKLGGSNDTAGGTDDEDGASLAGVKSSGPEGGNLPPGSKGNDGDNSPNKERHSQEDNGPGGPDRADGTTKLGTTEVIPTGK